MNGMWGQEYLVEHHHFPRLAKVGLRASPRKRDRERETLRSLTAVQISLSLLSSSRIIILSNSEKNMFTIKTGSESQGLFVVNS